MATRRTQIFKDSWAHRERRYGYRYPGGYTILPGEVQAQRNGTSDKTVTQAHQWFWRMVAEQTKQGYGLKTKHRVMGNKIIVE